MGICQDTGGCGFFSQFTATSHPLHVEEQPICAIDVSVKSLVLADHFLCATNQQRSADEGVVTEY